MHTWLWTAVGALFSAVLWIGSNDQSTMSGTVMSMNTSNQRDSVALLALYNSTGGTSWTNQWNFDQPIDNWYGVTTNANGDVIELDLTNNNLSGALPQEIGFLAELKVLKLGFNKLRGTLPSSVGSMIDLEEIFLFDNAFDLPIPDTVVNLKKLRILSLASNNIPGEIPKRIGQLSALEMLVLDGNDLSGPIPASIGQLSNLVFLDLHNNDLQGSIPSTVGNMTRLREFLLYDNELEGNIPDAVNLIDSLQFFWVHNNRLTGKLPTFGNPNLRSIRVERNQLTELPLLTSLDLGSTFPDGLSVENNQLSFDDILINYPLRTTSRLSYRPQDSLSGNKIYYANKGDRLEIVLPFDDTITSSRYRWIKDGDLYQLTDVNVMVFNIVDESDAGIYYAEVNNSIIGDLTLVTRKFEIIVRDSADCDMPESGTSCVNAPLFCHTSDLDLYCGTLQAALDTMACQDVAIAGETKWIGFTTDSTVPTIQILPYSCSSQNAGIQVVVYRNCRGKELVYCSSECTQEDIEIILDNARPNEAYYLAIRSCGGVCKYQIRARSDGQPISLELSGPINGIDTVCGPGEEFVYQIDNAPSSAQRFEWYVDEDTVSTALPQIAITWPESGSRELCVKAISECGESGILCKDIAVFPDLRLDEIRTEVVRNDSFYVINFKVVGGVGPIVIDGIGGVYNSVNKTFVSDPVECGRPYNIIVTDKNGCRQSARGLEVCNCGSEAGQLLNSTVESCGDEEALLGNANGRMLDSNDVGGYVILKENTFDRQKILDFSANGRFSVAQHNIDFDQQYFGFFIVGNNDGTGRPDLNDPCLDHSNGRSLVIYSPPHAEAGQDTFHCDREFSIRAIKSKTGSDGLWSQLAGPSVAFIDDDDASFTTVRTAAEGTYVFLWTETFRGCSDQDTLVIDVRPELEAQVIGPDSLCPDQEAILLLDKAFRRYLWDGGDTTPSRKITGPGQYCVRVFSADGCTRRFCKNVYQLVVESPEIMGRNVICKGDEEVLQVVPNYADYRWSNGDSIFFINIDSSGLYCITVTDFNGCSSTDCILVNDGGDRLRQIADTICFGDSIEVLGEYFSESGEYTISKDDEKACDTVVELSLNVLPEIFISDSLIIHDNGSGNGAISVNIKGGTPPYEYLWSNGSNIPFINNLEGGNTYSLTVSDDEGCQAEFNFFIRRSTSTYDQEERIWRLHPNPLSGEERLYLTLSDKDEDLKDIRFEIYTYGGDLLENGMINFDNTSKSGFIPISRIPEGVYLLYVTDDHGSAQWFKFIVIP